MINGTVTSTLISWWLYLLTYNQTLSLFLSPPPLDLVRMWLQKQKSKGGGVIKGWATESTPKEGGRKTQNIARKQQSSLDFLQIPNSLVQLLVYAYSTSHLGNSSSSHLSSIIILWILLFPIFVDREGHNFYNQVTETETLLFQQRSV